MGAGTGTRASNAKKISGKLNSRKLLGKQARLCPTSWGRARSEEREGNPQGNKHLKCKHVCKDMTIGAPALLRRHATG